MRTYGGEGTLKTLEKVPQNLILLLFSLYPWMQVKT